MYNRHLRIGEEISVTLGNSDGVHTIRKEDQEMEIHMEYPVHTAFQSKWKTILWSCRYPSFLSLSFRDVYSNINQPFLGNTAKQEKISLAKCNYPIANVTGAYSTLSLCS